MQNQQISQMRIGIDVTITRVNQAGTGLYTQQLVDAIHNLSNAPTIYQFAVNQTRNMATRKTIGSRLATLYRDLLWTHLILPYRVERANIDLLHMPANVIPLVTRVPTAVTILDTTILQTPQYFPKWHRNYARRFMPLAARRSCTILTISEHSKHDIVKMLNVVPEKVVVTPLAAAAHFTKLPKDDIAAIKQKYGLDTFILTVGTLEPRKNVIRLLQAFSELRNENKQVRLVHCGPQGWLFSDILNEVQRLNLQDSVSFLGRVPIVDLVALYNAATVFAYPSTYEGFGLPVLEAMACGCPVVTSAVSSLPEVAGDAAVLVDPYSVSDLASALHYVVNDPDVALDLRARGQTRAAGFSWARCAQETVYAYQQALGQ